MYIDMYVYPCTWICVYSYVYTWFDTQDTADIDGWRKSFKKNVRALSKRGISITDPFRMEGGHIQMHVCLMCICVCMFVYMYMYMDTYVYTCVYFVFGIHV